MARRESPEAARPLLTLALERALEAEELSAAAEAAASLSNSYYWTGEPRQAVLYAERRLEIAERGRDAFALRHAHSWLAMLATTTGDWDLYDTRQAVFQPARMTARQLEEGYWRAYRNFYRWGAIARSAAVHDDVLAGLRHFAYAAGWKKCERLWDIVIRAQRASAMLPVLETILSEFGRRSSDLPQPDAPHRVVPPLLQNEMGPFARG